MHLYHYNVIPNKVSSLLSWDVKIIEINNLSLLTTRGYIQQIKLLPNWKNFEQSSLLHWIDFYNIFGLGFFCNDNDSHCSSKLDTFQLTGKPDKLIFSVLADHLNVNLISKNPLFAYILFAIESNQYKLVKKKYW